VPKTSGTALLAALEAALMPRRSLRGLDACLFGSFQGFGTIAREIRSQIFVAPDRLPPGADFVGGHLAASTAERDYPEAQSLTLLREPQSRLLSHWLFWRAHPDAHLALWGDWADTVRKAEGSLETFLADPALACQTDNLHVRMLLWPHSLIPENGFIDERDDERLVGEALAQLDRFAFADIAENPGVGDNLQRWCGRPVLRARVNETCPVPPRLRSPLHCELTARALDLLDLRGRLDLRLWARLAQVRLPDLDVGCLRARILTKTMARHAWLMVG